MKLCNINVNGEIHLAVITGRGVVDAAAAGFPLNMDEVIKSGELSALEAIAANEKLKKEISRLEETAREKARWSDSAEKAKFGVDPLKVDKPKNYRSYQGAKAEKAMARSKAIEKRQQERLLPHHGNKYENLQSLRNGKHRAPYRSYT